MAEGDPKDQQTPEGEAQGQQPMKEFGDKLDKLAGIVETVVKKVDELATKSEKEPAVGMEELLDQLDKTKAEEGKQEEKPFNPETASMTETVNYIFQTIYDKYVQPLIQRTETLRVKMEVAEARQKYPDFDEYREQVYQIGSAQPTLTVEQAYLLAKGQAAKAATQTQKEESTKKEESGGETTPKPGVSPVAEKGGPQRAAAKEGQVLTLKEAATKAFEEVMEGSPEEGR